MSSRNQKAVGIKAEVLTDLASRFLINLSEEDRADVFKLCSQVELAHWFYLDLVRPEDPSLPACSFKEFMATIFEYCPFLVKDSAIKNLDSLITQWKAHKYKKPVRGAIILNRDLTKCLLVQGYPASTSWGFPKGKLEEGEDDMDTAVRELYEETGFDSRTIINKHWFLEATINDSPSRMYIIPGVPEDTHFEPKTRKEIRTIQWFNVSELPVHKKDLSAKLASKSANFFLIIPFISKLKKWISSHSAERVVKKRSISASLTSSNDTQPSAPPRPAQSAPLLPTPQTTPIPYPSPHPLVTRPARHPLPAPLQQAPVYQGGPLYTNVYPPHIAYPHGTIPHGTLPHGTLPHGTIPPGTLPHGTLPPGTLPHGTIPHGALVSRQSVAHPMFRPGPAVSRGNFIGPFLQPSSAMTNFSFNKDTILSANRVTMSKRP